MGGIGETKLRTVRLARRSQRMVRKSQVKPLSLEDTVGIFQVSGEEIKIFPNFFPFDSDALFFWLQCSPDLRQDPQEIPGFCAWILQQERLVHIMATVSCQSFQALAGLVVSCGGLCH